MKYFSKIFLSILLIATFSLLIAQENNEEFRATWVITWEHISSSSSASTNKARVRTILDNHKAANMNAVLWQARQSGTAYYNSSYEPWGFYAGYSNPGYDPLAYAIEEGHKRGMEVHAWFNCFAVSSTHAGAAAAEHPNWVCRDRDGNAMTEHRAFSPGIDSVRQYTVDVAMEIVNNYDIDGLHLDYVRWNEYSNSKQSAKFAKMVDENRMLDGMITEEQIKDLQENKSGRYLYDVEHPYSGGIPAGFNSWEDWWRWSVTEFVRTLHDSIQAVKPWVRLSVAALGKYRWSGWQGYGTVYQDAALWFNEGYIEQLTPMHYHWTKGSDFYDVLAGGGDNSWVYWIHDGINAGRLYSVGPGSYVFAENNVWYRHPEVVETCRTINWVDGFQFFSYGSWNGYQYWDEAGNTFFGNKTKIRDTQLIDNSPPEAPSLSLQKIDSLHYQITVTPPGAEIDNQWFAVYRSEDNGINVDNDEIIDIHFGDSSYTISDDFDGLQDFNGTYHYSATMLDRYWNESTPSNTEAGEMLPSFAPTVISTNPQEDNVVPVNTTITFTFSKTMNTNTFENGLTIDPEVDLAGLNWSDDWTDYNRTVTLDINGYLLYDTTYTITLDENITDINGKPIDGNSDGTAGDPFVLHFSTLDIDVIGPVIEYSYPNSESGDFDYDDVINIVFDELLDPETVNENSVTLMNNGNQVSIDPLLVTYKEKSVLSVKSFSQLASDADNTLTLTSDISDTAGNPMNTEISINFNTGNYYYQPIEVLDDFTTTGNWKDPEWSGSTSGTIDPETTFGISSAVYLPGVLDKKSGQLKYKWDEGATTHFLRLHCGSGVHFDTSYTLQCYVYGDGSNNQFRFSLYQYNSAGQIVDGDIAEVSKWITLDWIGWRLIEWDLGDTNSLGEWIGNGIMDGDSYRLESFQMIWPEGGDVSGRIYVDNLRLVRKVEGQAPPNYPPVLAELPDTSTTQGQYLSVKIYYTDQNSGDVHKISAYSDTSAITFYILGHTSGSQVYIDPQSNFIGIANIYIVVTDLGIGELADTASFILTVNSTSIEDELVPIQYALQQNYPNPFNPSTTIRFSISKGCKVKLLIYDILGRQVAELINENLNFGSYEILFNGSNLASGQYIYQLITDDKIITKKMMLLK